MLAERVERRAGPRRGANRRPACRTSVPASGEVVDRRDEARHRLVVLRAGLPALGRRVVARPGRTRYGSRSSRMPGRAATIPGAARRPCTARPSTQVGAEVVEVDRRGAGRSGRRRPRRGPRSPSRAATRSAAGVIVPTPFEASVNATSARPLGERLVERVLVERRVVGVDVDPADAWRPRRVPRAPRGARSRRGRAG